MEEQKREGKESKALVDTLAIAGIKKVVLTASFSGLSKCMDMD